MDETRTLLHYSESGTGPPLLLIHGLMVSGRMFDPVVDAFATHHRVIVPDLRGHGQSRRLPSPYSAEHMAADLSLLLGHLGIESTAVLGYSQGGAVAQQLALDDPDRCSRLVLACTYAFNMKTLREKAEGRLVPVLIRTLGMRRFAKLVISQGLEQLDARQTEWVVDLIATQDRDAMLGAWKAAMRFDSRARLAEIHCPTLVVAGSADDAVPLHHAKMLRDGIAGAELIVVDGVDHAFVWSHPEELVHVTEAFLRARFRSPSPTTRT